ncbi:MAG TPA: hypothetical protein VFP57_06910 [Sphingomicrobium sp.]|jgi:hypothetical protein|nr:hypothetical protein [Sphingomicrobium sp.]
MIDRHLAGDVALAVLLAVPTLSLSKPQPTVAHDNPTAAAAVAKIAAVERTPERRFGARG